MKKLVLALLVGVLCFSVSSAAKPLAVRPIEFGVDLGGGSPVGSYFHGRGNGGFTVGIGLRYNIYNTPFDAGFKFCYDKMEWRFPEKVFGDYSTWNHSYAYLLTAGYNLRQGRKFNPFAELGVGLVGAEAELYTGGKKVKYGVAIRPTIGIEMFRHLRIGVYGQIGRRGFNNIGATLGFVIGGGPLK